MVNWLWTFPVGPSTRGFLQWPWRYPNALWRRPILEGNTHLTVQCVEVWWGCLEGAPAPPTKQPHLWPVDLACGRLTVMTPSSSMTQATYWKEWRVSCLDLGKGLFTYCTSGNSPQIFLMRSMGSGACLLQRAFSTDAVFTQWVAKWAGKRFWRPHPVSSQKPSVESRSGRT